eukprot:TRINITY_DN32027_c0_g1_i1.p1 TRINITY_DN32027_c0_g1~~TRINITY_DN32027_c0_g1_i1.p1  ORF type:complete len:509 (+),score=102.14 TRINITY_DN32027_c0_g1_i1:58-1584(+)
MPATNQLAPAHAAVGDALGAVCAELGRVGRCAESAAATAESAEWTAMCIKRDFEDRIAAAERKAEQAKGEVAECKRAADERIASAELRITAAEKETVAAVDRAVSAERRVLELETRTRAVEELHAAAQRRIAKLENPAVDTAQLLQFLDVQQAQLDIEGDGETRTMQAILKRTATASEIKAMVHSRGGPPPGQQALTVCGLPLKGSTGLHETNLDAAGGVIVVKKVEPTRIPPSLKAGHEHAVALLPVGDEGSKLVQWGAVGPAPVLDQTEVTAVCAGGEFAAAIVADKVVVWGSTGNLVADLRQLEGKKAVQCSAWGYSLAVVTDDGNLTLCGPAKRWGQVPPELRGCVASASCGGEHVVVLTKDGEAYRFGPDLALTRVSPCGRKVLSASSGSDHFALVLDDATVLCDGVDAAGQCRVPQGLSNVTSCSCGVSFTVALHGNGSVSWWGEAPEHQSIATAGCSVGIAAAAAGHRCTVALTRDGRLLAEGEPQFRSKGLYSPPQIPLP